MKKAIAFLLVIVYCATLCSCTPVSPIGTLSRDITGSRLYYNDHTYVYNDNSSGKYRFDFEEDADQWYNIATKPYGIFYLLNNVTEYYGNDPENPDFIVPRRGQDLYVRDDLCFDHNTVLRLVDTTRDYSFKIADVITEHTIAFDVDRMDDYKPKGDFFVEIAQYPTIDLWFTVFECGGKWYLQEVHDGDYYEINDTFKEDLHRLGYI